MFLAESSTHLWFQVVSLFTAATMNRDLICTSSRGLQCRQSTGDRWETISLAKTSYASHRWQVIFTIFICPTFQPPWSAASFLYCFNEQEATQRVNTTAAPPNWHLHQNWGSKPQVLPCGSVHSFSNKSALPYLVWIPDRPVFFHSPNLQFVSKREMAILCLIVVHILT